MEVQISSYLNSKSNEHTVVIDRNRVLVTLACLNKLRDLNWLGNNVIDFYLQMIFERSKKNDHLQESFG